MWIMIRGRIVNGNAKEHRKIRHQESNNKKEDKSEEVSFKQEGWHEEGCYPEECKTFVDWRLEESEEGD